MKKGIFVFLCLLFLFLPFPAHAADYVIENFESQIEIQKDTKLLVKEKLDVIFSEDRHGIFRTIPTGDIRIRVLTVTDENGQKYQYQVSRVGREIEIKIGDPQRLISGPHTYEIVYLVSGAIKRFDDHDELYWNAFGGAWDTSIENARAKVSSPNAKIIKIDCFYGQVGSTEKCPGTFSESEAQFISPTVLGLGRDMTIVLALDKNNELIFPSTLQKILIFISDNWGYPVAFIPLIYMGISWFKKGRDKRFLSENVYYEPDDKTIKTVSIFERKFLPMVYSPIKNLTPAEMGTIVDERVDIRDVVAEITELARFKYLKIEVLKEKKIVGSRSEYKFTNLKKNPVELRDYQKYLLEKLFEDGDEVLLSDLKDKFYENLQGFRKKLYQSVHESQYFDQSPDKTRITWFIKWFASVIFATVILIRSFTVTGNFGPLILFGFLDVLSLPIAYIMPRKTAKGYQMHRQAKGLAFYIKKGKWRHEIAEKNLFFEEMLPLAISLGVVKRLAKDMEALGAKPPSYIHGTNNASVYSNLGNFTSSLGSTLSSSPKSSGGSGFSGGGAGGGSGGGGGGSW